jgi:peptidoglycan/LPS O-acetylase OafA/YrhL
VQTLTHADYLAMKRFPALDGLRAIAATMVVTFHFGGPTWRHISGLTGVQIFFVLSGFLITTLLLREESRYGSISFRGFYLRRAFRILPAYLVVLAVIYGLNYLRGQGAAIRETLPYYLTFLNEFTESPLFIYSWTIGLEQKFYLVWPLLFTLLAGGFARRISVVIALIAAMVPLLIVTMTWPYAPIQYSTILVGCLLAIVMHNPRGYRLVQPLTNPVIATFVAVAFAGVQLGLPWLVRPFDRFAFSSGYLPYALAVAALLPALFSTGPLSRLLASRPFVFVGERSYSLYLIQGVAAIVVLSSAPALRNGSGTIRMVIILVVALLAADLIYRWAEAPLIEVGRRLARRPDASTPVRLAPASQDRPLLVGSSEA